MKMNTLTCMISFNVPNTPIVRLLVTVRSLIFKFQEKCRTPEEEKGSVGKRYQEIIVRRRVAHNGASAANRRHGKPGANKAELTKM